MCPVCVRTSTGPGVFFAVLVVSCRVEISWRGADSIGFRGSSFATSHGGGDEQVVEPVGMGLEAVEVVERRATRRVVAARTTSRGVEVPRQGHGTHGETGGLGRAMQRAPCLETPVLMMHEPIERVGGAMGAREAIRARALGTFGAAF